MDSLSILVSALEDHYEDAYEHIKDEEEFHKFVEAWVNKQDIKSYTQNTKYVIELEEKDGDRD